MSPHRSFEEAVHNIQTAVKKVFICPTCRLPANGPQNAQQGPHVPPGTTQTWHPYLWPSLFLLCAGWACSAGADHATPRGLALVYVCCVQERNIFNDLKSLAPLLHRRVGLGRVFQASTRPHALPAEGLRTSART